MAVAGSGWGITRKASQNIEFTYKWAIEDFDFAMEVEVGGGKIESGRFCIPGVPGEFYMVVEKKNEGVIEGVYHVKLGDQELDTKFNFSVVLKSTVMGTKAAGKLEVIKEGANTLSGQFGDPVKHYFYPCDARSVQEFEPHGIKFDYRGQFYDGGHLFTTGSTFLLNLVVTITIPASKMATVGGVAEEEMKQSRLFDFQPLLLDPKHSDIVLKCAHTRFLCHKVILASR